MAHGGPATPAQVPSFIRGMLGGRATEQRVAAIARRYEAIGGASPLPAAVEAIGASLARRAVLPVYVGMLLGEPSFSDAFSRAAADGMRRLSAVYLSPHLPAPAARSCRDGIDVCVRLRGDDLDVRTVGPWHRRPEYLEAEAQATRAAAGRFPPARREGTYVVFSAHSVPLGGSEADDHYDRRVRESAADVAALLGLSADRWCVAYQSAPAVGTAWLGPHLCDVVADLASRDERDLVLAPLGFVVDSLDVLYDIDLDLTRFAAKLGLRLERAATLGGSPGLVDALLGAVLEQSVSRPAPKESV